MLRLGIGVGCYGKSVVKIDGKKFCYKIFLFKNSLEEKYLCYLSLGFNSFHISHHKHEYGIPLILNLG